MMTPLVSIVIPVYNGSNYMQQAIDSALSQTYKNIEVIVINDGSRDDGKTDEIARSYGEKIRYFPKENGGVSSALNMGIAEMRGEYFSWLSHDDVYEPDKIEKQVSALHDVDEKTLICCEFSQIDGESKPIRTQAAVSNFPEGNVDGKTVLECMLNKSTINGCCLLIPKTVFEKCGGFDESLRFCQDVFMWYKIFLSGYSLKYSKEQLVKSRVHANQLTQTGQALFKKECAEISDYLMKAFADASDSQHNLLSTYLLSDAKYLPANKVKSIIKLGKERKLLSIVTIFKAYLIFAYGKIRPIIRKLYYRIFHRLKTK